jgi:hypothetical protein
MAERIKSPKIKKSDFDGTITPCLMRSSHPSFLARYISGAAQELVPSNGNTRPLSVLTGSVGYLVPSGNLKSTHALS